MDRQINIFPIKTTKGEIVKMEFSQFTRRSFFKIAAVTFATVAAPLAIPSVSFPSFSTAINRNEKFVEFRGTSNGKILESSDHGKTWQICADFGEECSVKNVRSTFKGLVADIEHKGFSFSLQSKDGYKWIG